MVLQTRGMGSSCGQERTDRGTSGDVALYTFPGANAPHTRRAHQLAGVGTATFHSCPQRVMTQIHQTTTLYKRTFNLE